MTDGSLSELAPIDALGFLTACSQGSQDLASINQNAFPAAVSATPFRSLLE